MAGLRELHRRINARSVVFCLLIVSLLGLSATAYGQIKITTTALPPGNTAANYSFQLGASGGSSQYTWQLADGTQLPAGLSLNDAGVISGKPTAVTPGNPPIAVSFTVRVTDNNSPANTATQTFRIAVLPPGSRSLVFTQVYTGAKGSSSATYIYDYVEVFNASPAAIDLQNWTIQLSDTAGSFSTGKAYPIGSLDAYQVGTTGGSDGLGNYPAFQITYSAAFTATNCNQNSGTPINTAFPSSHCWLNPGQYMLVQIQASGSTTPTTQTPLPLTADLDLSSGSNAGPVSGTNWIGHSGSAAKPQPSAGKLALVNGVTAAATCQGSNPVSNPYFSPAISDFITYFAIGQTASNCWEGSGPAYYASSSTKNTAALVRTSPNGSNAGAVLGTSAQPTPCIDTDNNVADFGPMKIGAGGQANWILHNSQMYVTTATLSTPTSYSPLACTQPGGQPLNPVGPQVSASVDDSSIGLNEGGGSVQVALTVKVTPSSIPTSVLFNVNADTSSITGANSPFTPSTVGVPDENGSVVYTGNVSVPTTVARTFTIPVTVMDDAYRWAVNANPSTPINLAIQIGGSCESPAANGQTLQMNWNSALPVTLSGSLGHGCSSHATLAYAIADQPSNGSLSALSGNSITYTPNPGFSGQDSFSFTLTDTDAAEGPLTSEKAVVNITVSASGVVPTLSLQCPTATYDGDAHGCSTTLIPFVMGATAVTYSASGDAPSAAGTYSVNAAFTGNDPTQSTTASGTLVIEAAVPTLKLSCPSIIFDEVAHSCKATVTGVNGVVVNGTTTITYNGTADLPVNEGSYAASATFVSGDSNYTNATATGTLAITYRVVTIKANNQNVYYGATLPALTYTSNPSGYLEVAPACVSSVTSAASPGTYAGAITCSGAVKTAVKIVYEPGTLTIGPAPATVTANDQVLPMGSPVPTLTYAISPISIPLTTAPVCTTTATSASGPGKHPIVCTGGASTYYNMSYVDGTLTVVNPAAALIGLSPSSIAAGSGKTEITVTGSNFLQGAVVNWNGTARTTTFVSSTQLTATIPAADLASAGLAEISVINPPPAAGIPGALHVSVDSPATASGVFGVSVGGAGSFTVAHGNTTSIPLVFRNFPTGVRISALCYNAPVGVSCSYDEKTASLIITTASNTPAGQYQVLAVFSAGSLQTAGRVAGYGTLAYAVLMCPFGLIRLGSRRKKLAVLIMIAGLTIFLAGCGGSSSNTGNAVPPPSGSSQASTTVTLTVN